MCSNKSYNCFYSIDSLLCASLFMACFCKWCTQYHTWMKRVTVHSSWSSQQLSISVVRQNSSIARARLRTYGPGISDFGVTLPSYMFSANPVFVRRRNQWMLACKHIRMRALTILFVLFFNCCFWILLFTKLYYYYLSKWLGSSMAMWSLVLKSITVLLTEIDPWGPRENIDPWSVPTTFVLPGGPADNKANFHLWAWSWRF